MSNPLQRLARPLSDYVGVRVVRWRTGSREGQLLVLSFLVAVTAGITLVSLVEYNVMPVAWFIIPMLLGSLLLRYRPLTVQLAITVGCIVLVVIPQGLDSPRASTLVAMTIAALVVLYEASHNRSGLPGPLGEAMLVDLRDRLQAQGVVPPLPAGWRSQSAMRSAGGARFAGDFLVANLSDDETCLEMVLVDVCGKGVAAGTQSLQFAGALGGLIGSLPPLGLFAAGNDFLLRQRWDDGFATAVHVIVDLTTGDFTITSGGHPPALRWVSAKRVWEVDGARGMALGILKHPEFEQTSGTLGTGDALMFYTDGVVESRTLGVSDGIVWLQKTARAAVSGGFDGAPRRILSKVAAGDDDRAVLILSRDV